jgi:hypothetical protein
LKAAEKKLATFDCDTARIKPVEIIANKKLR